MLSLRMTSRGRAFNRISMVSCLGRAVMPVRPKSRRDSLTAWTISEERARWMRMLTCGFSARNAAMASTAMMATGRVAPRKMSPCRRPSVVPTAERMLCSVSKVVMVQPSSFLPSGVI